MSLLRQLLGRSFRFREEQKSTAVVQLLYVGGNAKDFSLNFQST
jgi:hypothetical protein